MSKLKNRAMRILQTQNNDGYVKDGLVLWLDGSSYLKNSYNDEGQTYLWYDSSNFTNMATLLHMQKTENAVIFDGTNTYGRINANQPFSMLNILTGIKDRTVEIVCKLNDTASAQTIFLGCDNNSNVIEDSAAGLWYRPASGGMKVGSHASQYCSIVSEDSLKDRACYSVVYGKTDINDYVMYQNGVECPKGAAEGNMHNTLYPTIGCRVNASGAYSYRMNGEINCIRVYDRKLTNAEREHNLVIDRRRFNF